MTFREKLADWISGGKITEHREREIAAHSLALNYLSNADGYRDALLHIVHKSTPKMAHIGKRMAKIAQEALDDA